MLGLLSTIWGARWLIGGAAALSAVAGGWGYVSHLQARAAQAEAQTAAATASLAAAVAAADASYAALEIERADRARAVAALRRERDALAARAARVRTLYREIDNASADDDGPVAPVLARTLDRLRSPGTAEGGHPGEDRPGPPAPTPLDLPAGAAAAGR